MRTEIVLFDKKEDCCGCGSCMNVCPKSAISMQEDEFGYKYPAIDTNLCVGCGLCQKACAFQNGKVEHEPLLTFAASARKGEILRKSSSGGLFAVLAGKTLSENGAVFGAAYDERLQVRHICIESAGQLPALQGSKYVQSDTGNTFSQVKKMLREGRKVLYSGTPCQIAGLYGYLGGDHENLTTIDLICHGVPNGRMFGDYLKSLGNVERFTFRDKSIGWGISGTSLVDGKTVKIWESASPYVYYFSKGMIHRDSCYQCRYACKNRPAYITLGDFWGIEKQHPEFLKVFRQECGISAVIVNSEKGKRFLRDCQGELVLKKSEFGKVQAGNTQLRQPSTLSPKRAEILALYRDGGWEAVEKRFNENIGLHRYSSQIKSYIPASVKSVLKKVKH